jgi:hypothetical protein
VNKNRLQITKSITDDNDSVFTEDTNSLSRNLTNNNNNKKQDTPPPSWTDYAIDVAANSDQYERVDFSEIKKRQQKLKKLNKDDFHDSSV